MKPMADEQVIFAYLEAGAKSSPVALDPGLDTGKPETIWLFNLARNEFVEYRRDIVEAKLRDFTAREKRLCEKLRAAFARARDDFQSRAPIPLRVSEPPPEPAVEVTVSQEPDEDMLNLDSDPETDAALDEELE